MNLPRDIFDEFALGNLPIKVKVCSATTANIANAQIFTELDICRLLELAFINLRDFK